MGVCYFNDNTFNTTDLSIEIFSRARLKESP